MGLLIVDETKCKQDGICMDICPSRVIGMGGKDKFPKIPPRLENGCIQCGHCVSVCPHGALGHRLVSSESCPAINPALVIDERQAEQFLRSRRSIRVFRGQAVEKEKIKRLIEIARYAPTAGNSQRVVWRVVTDRQILEQTADLTAAYLQHVIETREKGDYPVYYPAMVKGHKAGRDPIIRRAPVLLVASTPEMASNGTVDISLAFSYLELMAPSLGLGTCWAGLVYSALLNDPGVKDLLGLSVDAGHFYAMLMGYPKYKFQRLPERRPPRIDWG